MLSLAIKEPPHAQTDKINDSTHCGEFNSLGGHAMQREHWGCKVWKMNYIEKATWTDQSTREEQWHHKANIPVLLGGMKLCSLIEVGYGSYAVTSYSVSCFLRRLLSACSGLMLLWSFGLYE